MYRGIELIQLNLVGNVCQRMIGPEKRDEVVAAYKFDPETTDAQDFATLLQSFNVILRLMSSWRREIKIEEFQHYVQNCHLKLHDMFEWLRDNGMDSLLNWTLLKGLSSKPSGNCIVAPNLCFLS